MSSPSIIKEADIVTEWKATQSSAPNGDVDNEGGQDGDDKQD